MGMVRIYLYMVLNRPISVSPGGNINQTFFSLANVTEADERPAYRGEYRVDGPDCSRGKGCGQKSAVEREKYLTDRRNY